MREGENELSFRNLPCDEAKSLCNDLLPFVIVRSDACRNRLRISSTQAFYLIVNNKSMASMSKTLTEVYRENKDDDGFLYVTYASQEMFGRSAGVF